MKFKVKKENLASALEKVSGIIGSRSTLPILSNVLLEAQENKLTLITTDLEIRITTIIDAEIINQGKTTIAAKRFLTLVKDIRDSDLEIEVSDNKMFIRYKNGKMMLYTLNPEDFPPPPQISPTLTFALQQADLARMIRLIEYSASRDDSRKVLNGIFFSMKESIFTAVATDGKRLALAEKHVNESTGQDGDCIIPPKTAIEVQRILDKDGPVKIEVGNNQVRFSTSTLSVISKVVEGSYPNFRQVIPTSFSRKFEVKSADFLSTLKITSHISDENACAKLSVLSNKLVLNVTATEIGEAEETIDITYSGPETNLMFNPRFLMDPFRIIDSDLAIFNLNEGFSPFMISAGEGFLYVIMPIRR